MFYGQWHFSLLSLFREAVAHSIWQDCQSPLAFEETDKSERIRMEGEADDFNTNGQDCFTCVSNVSKSQRNQTDMNSETEMLSGSQ